jgi:hypothetical protein
MAWEPLDVEEVSRLLAAAPFPWWISGGLAIDLFLGRETRSHEDLDVGVLRRDQCALYAILEDFEVHAARSGTLTELTAAERGRGLAAPDHGLWCRRRGRESFDLELLLNEGRGEDWVFRRDPRVRRPLREIFARAPGGVPYLVPEVQLLFKAKTRRPKDEADFESARPALSPNQRAWLADALRVVHPDHPWTAHLT